MKEIKTLKDVTDSLGINYMAAWHLSEFNVLNETVIIEDLKNGLIFEWLKFIDDHTDSYTNNHEEAIIKLFSEELSDEISIDLPSEELQRMIKDRNYAGAITVLNLDQKKCVVSTVLIRLKLQQYIDLIELRM